MTTRRAQRRRTGRIALILILVGSLSATAAGAVWTNAFGAAEKLEHLMDRIYLAIDPPSDRPTLPTIEVTPPPSDPPVTPRPAGASALPGAPTPTPAPTPVRKPVNVKLAVADPRTTFASQYTNTWCTDAAVQMVLAMHGLANTSVAFQRKLDDRLKEWETRGDAHAGGWGPAAIAEALAAFGAKGYEVRAYKSRAFALHDAAVALSKTGAPVVLVTWRGAHSWVMTGYRADADPTLFANARVTGTYIFDPWYPRVSTIWGPSDPPGAFQDVSEMQRNFLPWQRPEGKYPDRDGKFLVVAPTIPLAEQRG